jgi:hypothetical protein
MIIYLYFIIALFSLSVFLKLNCYTIVKSTVLTKYNRWVYLNTLVGTQYKNFFLIFWFSLTMIYKAIYLSFIQYMNNSVVKLNRKTFELTYTITGKTYKILITPDRGPDLILQISDQNYNDVSDKIIPYIGPNYNWHNNKFSPKFFGYESLTFELHDGSNMTFSGNNNIHSFNI